MFYILFEDVCSMFEGMCSLYFGVTSKPSWVKTRVLLTRILQEVMNTSQTIMSSPSFELHAKSQQSQR